MEDRYNDFLANLDQLRQEVDMYAISDEQAKIRETRRQERSAGRMGAMSGLTRMPGGRALLMTGAGAVIGRGLATRTSSQARDIKDEIKKIRRIHPSQRTPQMVSKLTSLQSELRSIRNKGAALGAGTGFIANRMSNAIGGRNAAIKAHRRGE